jgi:hypothetical protein
VFHASLPQLQLILVDIPWGTDLLSDSFIVLWIKFDDHDEFQFCDHVPSSAVCWRVFRARMCGSIASTVRLHVR